MFADNRLILCEINTERLIVGNVALDPLNIWAKFVQDFVRFRCCSPQLIAFKSTHLWNITLDDEFLQRHYFTPICTLLDAVHPVRVSDTSTQSGRWLH